MHRHPGSVLHGLPCNERYQQGFALTLRTAHAAACTCASPFAGSQLPAASAELKPRPLSWPLSWSCLGCPRRSCKQPWLLLPYGHSPLSGAWYWRALHAQGMSKSVADAYCFHDIMASCPEQGRGVTSPPGRHGCRSNTGARQQWKTGPGHGCINQKPLSLLTGDRQQVSAGAFWAIRDLSPEGHRP